MSEGSSPIVGQVKWFSNQLNYGFITVLTEGQHNGIDVFVHQTNVCPQVSNYRTLTQGEYVSFILTHNEEEDFLPSVHIIRAFHRLRVS